MFIFVVILTFGIYKDLLPSMGWWGVATKAAR
jgi:hypothetical protein